MLALNYDIQMHIIQFLNSDDIHNISSLYLSTGYRRRAEDILKWLFYRKKRQFYKMVFRVNRFLLYQFIESDFLVKNIDPSFSLNQYLSICLDPTRIRNPYGYDGDRRRKILYYYFSAWTHYFYKYKERQLAYQYKTRFVQKQIRGDDSDFRILKLIDTK